jgi:uncharacterized cupredoxin-like copper-binding protein
MRHFTRLSLGAVLVALAVGALAATSGLARPSARAATTKVTVTASEFKFVLSRKSVHVGTVVFTVRNKGKVAHDFKIKGKKTPLLKPGASAKLVVAFKKKGSYAYLCTVPGHAAAGMKGKLKVT